MSKLMIMQIIKKPAETKKFTELTLDEAMGMKRDCRLTDAQLHGVLRRCKKYGLKVTKNLREQIRARKVKIKPHFRKTWMIRKDIKKPRCAIVYCSNVKDYLHMVIPTTERSDVVLFLKYIV